MRLVKWASERKRRDFLGAFTMDRIAMHNKSDDCWMVMEGIVYDVTEFIAVHPGGARTMMKYAGKDCTQAFNKAHAYVNIRELLENDIVGVLVTHNN
ncbi:cytochrome B5 [Ordospora colligata]|uniref:Cytochrome B5 n=1 Tax=Ordospora colligata OC4 TaxID=1354746 RepID=A0A0B2UNA9_9MICR|nr:cytochrome B5 [Ordospora colligata OC4]KHN70450.1 cytochrome B5 [Ordospora colligata OC4]TBU17200.1 cytochrome B5 [Ordospora colligata]TBU17450.1 cytochrome B5 [Ordospora colligata]TBU19630.1 cytochrome B5 [Ordospora colligata]